MAKTKKKNQPQKGSEILESPDALAEKLTRTEKFLEQNRKMVLGIGGAIVVVLATLFGYRYYVSNQNREAQGEMFQAVYYFEADSLQMALEGDGNNYGLLEIIDEYPRTEAANLAHYYAGISLLKLSRYEEAIDHLRDFSASDYVVQARAYALIGDAHMELENYNEAASFYEKAANYKSNEYFTPIYLMDAALAYENAGDLDQALESYEEIVNNYSTSSVFQDAQKQMSRLEGLLSS